jgi:hypothetical protein
MSFPFRSLVKSSMKDQFMFLELMSQWIELLSIFDNPFRLKSFFYLRNFLIIYGIKASFSVMILILLVTSCHNFTYFIGTKIRDI